MTNWHDPAVEAAEGRSSSSLSDKPSHLSLPEVALIKLIHAAAGLYIWEFVLNFDYECSIITGKRKFTWAAPIYLACRWSTLLAVVIHLMNLDTPNGINCKVWVILMLVFSQFAYLSASCLIILRIYALWDCKKVIIAVPVALLLANIGTFCYVVAITHAHQNGNVCEIDHIVDTRIAYVTTYITDLVHLSLMLFGIFRRAHLPGHGGIWLLLCTQGLIYVAVVTLACTPTVTFLFLNLNDIMDEMFMVPALIIVSICAQRIYRGLVDSATINGRVQGALSAPRPSSIRFAHLDRREENTRVTGGAVHDLYPQATTQP